MSETSGLKLQGKLALVTGAGRSEGIGIAICKHFVDNGAKVAILDISTDVGKLVAKTFGNDTQAKGYTCDVTQESEIKKTIPDICADFDQSINIAVFNAAFWKVIPAHQLTMGDFDVQTNINLRAVFMGFKYCYEFCSNSLESVIFISSVQAFYGLPGHSAYAAAKAGLIGLANQLAGEYGPNIRVNTILPGPINTGLALHKRETKDSQQAYDMTVQATALKRLGEPKEVASVATFLASSDASYITGSSLYVDGGWSILKSSA